MKRYLLMACSIIFVILFACSNGSNGKEEASVPDVYNPNEFSSKDMAIIEIKTGKKVNYGMSRSDAEKVIGKGEISGTMKYMIEYDNGLVVAYRDDTLVYISLKESSKGIYKTARGAEVGMLKSDIVSLYGGEHQITQTPNNLDYYFDNNSKKFMDVPPTWNQENAINTYIVSTELDDSEYATKVMITDGQFAAYYN